MENMVVPSRRGSWIVAAVFVAVVCVGAWVGIRAGDLAHRAPRGSGTRIAVLGPLSASGTELDLATLVQDAIVRDLSSLPTVTVIPPLELRSKRLQMLRGGVDDASDADAAKVLDADVVLLVRMDPRTGAAELVKDGAVLAHIDAARIHDAAIDGANANGANTNGANASGADVNGANVNGANAYGADANGALADTAHFGGTLTQLPALLATARAVVPGAGPPGAPATMSAVAYAHFLAGEKLAQGSGLLRDAAPHFERAIAADGAFADAWAALAWCSFLTDDRSPQQTTRTKEAVASARRHRARLGTQASLVVDALAGWLEHDDAPPSLQPALREPAIAGARALTVRLPEERNGHLLLGRAYRELFHGASEGLRHLEAGRRLTPDYFPITQQIVIAWLDLSDRNHAEQALRGFLTTSLGHVEATRLLAGLTRTPSAAR